MLRMAEPLELRTNRLRWAGPLTVLGAAIVVALSGNEQPTLTSTTSRQAQGRGRLGCGSLPGRSGTSAI
jgi:hypothetical protein